MRAGEVAVRLDVIRRTRALFVDAMTTAPALDPAWSKRHREPIWPKGSVGWWNERVQACDDLLATYEKESTDA